MPIADAVAAVRDEIAAACARVGRDPAEVALLAVTKSQGPEVLEPLAACGLHDYGENRVDHLALMAGRAPSASRFHHIGRIQSRQIPDIVRHAAVVHGLVDAGHARRLDRGAGEAGRRIGVVCQVNTSGETAKAGVSPDDLDALIGVVRGCAHLDLLGLMTMAPELGVHADEGGVRACFARLRGLARDRGLARLSMGMSLDLAIAVEEGSTDLRIGTRLFV